jgi:GH35 family endo-1,4-beta-xylanase
MDKRGLQGSMITFLMKELSVLIFIVMILLFLLFYSLDFSKSEVEEVIELPDEIFKTDLEASKAKIKDGKLTFNIEVEDEFKSLVIFVQDNREHSRRYNVLSSSFSNEISLNVKNWNFKEITKIVIYSVFDDDLNGSFPEDGEVNYEVNHGVNYNVDDEKDDGVNYEVDMDDDDDGILDEDDNCIDLYNIDQLDSDGDGVGDECEEEEYVEEFEGPNLLLPKQNAVIVSEHFALFWSVSEELEQEKYHVQVSLQDNFQNFIIDENRVSQFMYHSVNVECNKKYYWRVRVNVDNSWSDFSDISSFDTASCDKKMLIGTTTHARHFDGKAGEEVSTNYKNKLDELFSIVVPGGDGATGKVQRTKDNYYWKNIDDTLDWTEANGIKFTWHYLIADDYEEDGGWPEWFSDLSQEEIREYMEAHVRNITQRYEGRIETYIASNHALRRRKNRDDNYMGSGWTREEAIANVLRWANEEDPNAILIINEAHIFYGENVAEEYAQLGKSLIELEAPIEGIGIMSHLGTEDGKIPSDKILIERLDIIASTGLPIHITELDLGFEAIESLDPNDFFEANGIFYSSWWEYQAYSYRHLYELYAAYGVDRIVNWKLYDGISWREGTGLFDEEFNEKPIYHEIVDILKANKH